VFAPESIDRLKDKIRRAFPPSLFAGRITDCDCDECRDIRDGLQGKLWSGVPPSFVDFTASPVLLTPEAFRQFIPAYMMRALDDLAQETAVLEYTVYGLSPHVADEVPEEASDRSRVEYLQSIANRMTLEQRESVRCFLQAAATKSANAKWLRPFADEAIRRIWSEVKS
jgi:hypothetical protein